MVGKNFKMKQQGNGVLVALLVFCYFGDGRHRLSWNGPLLLDFRACCGPGAVLGADSGVRWTSPWYHRRTGGGAGWQGPRELFVTSTPTANKCRLFKTILGTAPSNSLPLKGLLAGAGKGDSIREGSQVGLRHEDLLFP